MKKKNRTFISLIAAVLLLAACQPHHSNETTNPQTATNPPPFPTTESSLPTECTQPTETTQPTRTTHPTEATQPTETTQPTADPRTALTDAEIAELQSFFAYPKDSENRYPKAFYHIALAQTYTDPKEIDLFRFFYNGDETPWTETDGEKSLINNSVKDGEFMDHFRSAPENMDTILKMCFGLTLADTKKTGLSQFVYSKDTGCYYTVTNSPAPFAENLKIVGGFHENNGDLEVTYTAGSGKFIMKLRPVENSYHILSNQKA